MKTFVIGDIHGAYKALLQCFERSGFDREQDHLIALGDVCDGWSQVKESIDELLKVKHLTFILGNHDAWTLHWAKTGQVNDVWFAQGGNHTILSYQNGPMPQSHVDFLAQAPRYVLSENRFLSTPVSMLPKKLMSRILNYLSGIEN